MPSLLKEPIDEIKLSKSAGFKVDQRKDPLLLEGFESNKRLSLTIKPLIEKKNESANEGQLNRTQQLKEDMSKIDNVKIQKNIYMKFDFIQNKKTSKTIIKILNVLVNKLMKIVNNLLEKQIKRDKINFTEYIT